MLMTAAVTALVAPVFALGPLRHPPPAMQQGRFPYRFGGPGYEPRGYSGFGGTPQQSTAQAAEMARQRAEAARVAEKAASEAARLAQEEADAIAELVKAEEAAAKARRDEVEALQQAAVAARERAEASARAIPPGPMPVGSPPGIDPFPYPVRMSSFGPPVRRAPARAQRTRGGRRQAPHSTRDGTGEASAPSTSLQGASSVRREALTRNQAAFHGR